jgi:Spy/CpxP family protein refolding chaperone
MNVKPYAILLALTLACMAAAVSAAEATKSSAAPSSHGTHVVTTKSGDQKTVTVEVGDASDIDTDALGLEEGPDGEGGDRHVIVRRIVRDGKRGEACGPMCGGMGRGMGAGRGPRAMGDGMGMGPGPGMFAHMTRALDLSDTQREKLAAIHERQQRRDIQARADLQIARLDLRKAMSAEKPDGFAINTQIDRAAKLRSDMAKAHVASLLEARALLTPEQQKQMREMHMKGPGAGGPGMGRGLGMGPGGMGGPGMGHGGMPMRIKVERDTVIRR